MGLKSLIDNLQAIRAKYPTLTNDEVLKIMELIILDKIWRKHG